MYCGLDNFLLSYFPTALIEKQITWKLKEEEEECRQGDQGADPVNQNLQMPDVLVLTQNRGPYRKSSEDNLNLDKSFHLLRFSQNSNQLSYFFRYVSNNWVFKPSSTHHYVNAQLTYLTLRWDELLDDLIECKKKPTLKSR